MTSSPEPADTPAGLRSVASSGELVMIDTMLIHAALTAYAAGDAFGVAYEFLDHPKPVDPRCSLTCRTGRTAASATTPC